MARVSRATAAKSRRQVRQASELYPSINTLRSEQEQDDKQGLTYGQWFRKGEEGMQIESCFGYLPKYINFFINITLVYNICNSLLWGLGGLGNGRHYVIVSHGSSYQLLLCNRCDISTLIERWPNNSLRLTG